MSSRLHLIPAPLRVKDVIRRRFSCRYRRDSGEMPKLPGHVRLVGIARHVRDLDEVDTPLDGVPGLVEAGNANHVAGRQAARPFETASRPCGSCGSA